MYVSVCVSGRATIMITDIGGEYNNYFDINTSERRQFCEIFNP